LEAFLTFLTTGQMVSRLHLSTTLTFVALAVLTLAAGSGFCGWLCPLGSLQEWVGKLGQRLFGRRFALPDKIDRPLQYARYAMLAWVVLATAAYSTLVFREYDPYIALAHVTAFEFTTGTVVLGLTLVASLFVERPWCRYLCPLGGFVGLTSKIGFLRIRREPTLCTNCAACNKVCPMKIDVAGAKTMPTTCNSCLNCVAACPRAGALTLATPSLKLMPRETTKEAAGNAH
jgi:polyferredoxin